MKMAELLTLKEYPFTYILAVEAIRFIFIFAPCSLGGNPFSLKISSFIYYDCRNEYFNKFSFDSLLYFYN